MRGVHACTPRCWKFAGRARQPWGHRRAAALERGSLDLQACGAVALLRRLALRAAQHVLLERFVQLRRPQSLQPLHRRLLALRFLQQETEHLARNLCFVYRSQSRRPCERATGQHWASVDSSPYDVELLPGKPGRYACLLWGRGRGGEVLFEATENGVTCTFGGAGCDE